MGQALECPLCKGCRVSVEEVRFTRDIWSNLPLLEVETMLAFVCKDCRHVKLVHPVPVKLYEGKVYVN